MKGLLLFSLATVAGMVWAFAGSGALDSTDGSEILPAPSAPGPRPQALPKDYASWLQWSPKEDARPWWKRLKFSLFGEMGVDKSAIKLSTRQVEISGHYRDTDRPAPTVQSIAGGIKVEVDL